MFDINEVYYTIDNYKSCIYFATAYCKVNELRPPYPGTVVRVVPVTGNLPRCHKYNGYYMCYPKVSNPYFLYSFQNEKLMFSTGCKLFFYPNLRALRALFF